MSLNTVPLHHKKTIKQLFYYQNDVNNQQQNYWQYEPNLSITYTTGG